jgi:hypothetical protein
MIANSLLRAYGAEGCLSTPSCVQLVVLWSKFFWLNTGLISARELEFAMDSTLGVHPAARYRLALIVAGIFALLGPFVTAAPAQAGYYESSYPCGYRCGYPVYHYYPRYHHYGCYSCGPHLLYERRYVEREFVERRYGYGGYRHYYGCNPYVGCHRHYGYYPYGGYRSWRPGGYGYGYGGVGRRWAPPYLGYGPYAERYEEAPRPPAPVPYGDDY